MTLVVIGPIGTNITLVISPWLPVSPVPERFFGSCLGLKTSRCFIERKKTARILWYSNMAMESPIIYPLVNIQKAIEHSHRNSGFTHEKWWIFHSYVNVYQRVADVHGFSQRLTSIFLSLRISQQWTRWPPILFPWDKSHQIPLDDCIFVDGEPPNCHVWLPDGEIDMKYPILSHGMLHIFIYFPIISPNIESHSGWWFQPTPLKNTSSSVGMMTFPIYGKS